MRASFLSFPLCFLVLISTIATSTSATQSPAQSAKSKRLAIINGPVTESVRGNGAVIAWTTNTGGSSVVRYGTDSNNLTQTAQSPYADKEDAAYQTHRVTLKNLQPGTKYFYVADSGQGEDTGSEAKSPVSSFVTTGGDASAATMPGKIALYRSVSPTSDHFFTTSKAESVNAASGFKDEGTTGYLLSAPYPGSVPLFRLYSPGKNNAHFYTTSPQERDNAVASGSKSEGITGYISSTQSDGTTALFRLYNPANNDHLYTTNKTEKDNAAKSGYKDEGVTGYIWTSEQ